MSAIVIIFLLSFNKVIVSQCPPSSGIYLMQRGVCYPNGSYFHDASIRIYPLMCVSPGSTLNGGQWVRAINGDPVICNSNSDTNPLRCTNVTSPNANLSLYLPGGQNFLSNREGFYQCCLPTSCSDPNTNIITANIFRWAEIAEIRVDLPSNITALPQQYTLHAIKIGQLNHSFLHDATWYYESGSASSNLTSICNGQERSGYSCSVGNGTPLFISNGTYDYNLTVMWNGENISSGILSQSKNNGDHVFRFHLTFGTSYNPIERYRYQSLAVPASPPFSLTVVNKTISTITLSWAALSFSDANGYVVNVTSDTNIVKIVRVDNGDQNIITTLENLRAETTYSITIRAYQQLLGPATSAIHVQTLPAIYSINWTLISSISQLTNTEYRIDCVTATDTNHSTSVYWLVNGVKKNSLMFMLVDSQTYNNSILVYPNPSGVSIVVTCIAKNEGNVYSKFVKLHAPSSSPSDVQACILDSDSIAVNWKSSETNGYIIKYNTVGGKIITVFTTQDKIVLQHLLPMNTYTISVYSYIDLPSNGTATVLKFDVPSIASLSVSNISESNITVYWNIPISDYITYYTISLVPFCSELPMVNDTVSVTHCFQANRTYIYTARSLHSGMNYTISVKVGNPLGESNSESLTIETTSAVPLEKPTKVHINTTNNRITWNEVNCTVGRLTGYTVKITGIIAHSTERNIDIQYLSLPTKYNISIAACNSAGTGPFSNPVTYTMPEPGPVDSVSSVMSTKWAIISWSAHDSVYVLYYEIKFHVSESNNLSSYQYTIVFSRSTFVNITNLTGNTSYFFAVRPYTVNGYGAWRVITNKTLVSSINLSASSTTSSYDNNHRVFIGLTVSVGVLLMLLIVSVIINIILIIRASCSIASSKSTRVDDNSIVMQVCEPYVTHNFNSSGTSTKQDDLYATISD